MPLAYRIDQSQGIVVITGDYAEPPEWRELLTAISQDAAFGGGWPSSAISAPRSTR